MVKKYIPEQGDVVWLDFDPTLGHEQKGMRPGLVISSKLFNEKSGLAYICPITTTRKNYVYRIEVVEAHVSGFVMIDQLKSVDWKARNPKFISKISDVTLADTIQCIQTIISSSLK